MCTPSGSWTRSRTAVRLAAGFGLDADVVRRFLDSDDHRDEVAAEDFRARRMGIEGVPCFIVNERYAVAGAQEPEAFFPLMDLADLEATDHARGPVAVGRSDFDRDTVSSRP